ncbi:MAG: multicopper oxidase domain-containing protein [Acidimicrobiia bacterium]|nr:multicopper oxidase domain-containing protein [Acidimicrobiia bacterium]
MPLTSQRRGTSELGAPRRAVDRTRRPGGRASLRQGLPVHPERRARRLHHQRQGIPGDGRYAAKLGERVRFRFMNEGLMVHPIHLHGFTLEVFARDGYPLPQPFLRRPRRRR